MTRSTVLRWVWFVVCAALAVAAGCATPVHVTWSAHAGSWSRSGTLELRCDPAATGGELLVVREVSREEWPTPTEWAYRESRGLPLPDASSPAAAPEPVRVEVPTESASDLRRLRTRIRRTPAVKLVRGKVVAAPAPARAATSSPSRARVAPRPDVTSASAPAPRSVAADVRVADAPHERRASRREELAMLAAILALALGTIAVPFMVSRRRAR